MDQQGITESESNVAISRAQTGIAGLDDILGGGFPKTRLFLVEGDPGSGKTTLALQFLLEGVRRGESGLYVTLSETKDELTSVATSHGWSLDEIAINELPMKKAISVVKKRSGRHEGAIREYSLSENGLDVGKPLANFHGILTGVPQILSGYGGQGDLQ